MRKSADGVCETAWYGDGSTGMMHVDVGYHHCGIHYASRTTGNNTTISTTGVRRHQWIPLHSAFTPLGITEQKRYAQHDYANGDITVSADKKFGNTSVRISPRNGEVSACGNHVVRRERWSGRSAPDCRSTDGNPYVHCVSYRHQTYDLRDSVLPASSLDELATLLEREQ